MKLKLVGNYTYGKTKNFRVFENDKGVKYLEKTTSINNYEILKTISDISIENENLLSIIAFNKKDEETLNYYIEFLEGKTLEQIIFKKELISFDDAKKIILQICLALKALHDQEVLHRDIKPANIMLLDDNIIKVIDFDISRKYDVEKERDTTLLGTPGYAAPEQYGFTQTDSRSDIYSFGITIEEFLNTCGEDYKYNFMNIIEKAKALDINDRFNNIDEIIIILQKDNPGYFSNQLNQINDAKAKGLTEEQIKYIANINFNAKQIGVLKHTFLENVDLEVIKIMLHKEFSSKQMWQIKRGFLDGLSLRQIKEYAKPFYNQDEMAIYRYGLINNKTIKSIYNDMHVFNQLINEEVMSKERIQIIKFGLLSGIDFKRIIELNKEVKDDEELKLSLEKVDKND